MSINDEEEEWHDQFFDNLPPGCYPSYYEDDDEDYFGGDDWPPGRYDELDDYYDEFDYYDERKESIWNIIRRTWWKYIMWKNWAFSTCPDCGRLNILGGHEDHIPFQVVFKETK